MSIAFDAHATRQLLSAGVALDMADQMLMRAIEQLPSTKRAAMVRKAAALVTATIAATTHALAMGTIEETPGIPIIGTVGTADTPRKP